MPSASCRKGSRGWARALSPPPAPPRGPPGGAAAAAAGAGRRPRGGAPAVDRERCGALVESRLAALPNVEIRREEITAIPSSGTVIVACGPLPSDELANAIDDLVGGRLHYYDAAAPIVALDSIDTSVMYRKSRYDKGEGEDYLNIPLDRETYAQFIADLRALPKHDPHGFEADAAAGGGAGLPDVRRRPGEGGRGAGGAP